MSARDDGGPAFPQPAWPNPDGSPSTNCPWFGYGMGGMSLRDWFAGMVVCEAYRRQSNQLTLAQAAEFAADIAYAVADAMLKERAK